ncbi:GTP pyrophosphokinase [Hydrogenispora ethanolica]|uniref:GTP pyrophosphokinase n=1 Tax=Hydrogenispora ethanolica TaxID=1082276 RepID=A0A4R1QZA1_HYDET|nr:HD domain-containing protein [Hydrogenispora ethanolica]TCL58309.1 GTP pyrophosphokinase [Hydrogenispora ethanolica]
MELSATFDQALVYASQIHRTQHRKGSGIPYFSHLMAVAALVLENGGSETEAIAALLHDAVEDQGGMARLDEIRRLFGPAVAEVVAGCTDAWGEPKPAWEERKRRYLEHLPQAAPATLLVSSADKLHNARTILEDYRQFGETLWPRFSHGKPGILWYYRALATAYRRAGAPERIVAELERVLDELEKMAGR